MQPTLKKITKFQVAGLTVRTKNSDEFEPEKAQIPNLWNALFATKSLEKIPHQPPVPAVYGVYANYESDASGEYDLTVGALIHAPSTEFEHVEIASGDYLVFEARGELPAALIHTWGKIWAYFDQHPDIVRSYQTDFEQYAGAQAVDIYIGITP